MPPADGVASNTAPGAAPSGRPTLLAVIAPGARWQDVYLPLAVLVGGTAAGVMIWSRITTSLAATLAAVGIMLLIQLFIFTPVSLLALTWTARVYDLGLGYLIPALAKLVAISLGAGAVADVLFFSMMMQVDFDHWILAAGLILYVILCGIPLAAMFMIGLQETLVIVGVMVAPRVGLLYLIASLFPALFDTTI